MPPHPSLLPEGEGATPSPKIWERAATAWTQEVEQCMEQLPGVRVESLYNASIYTYNHILSAGRLTSSTCACNKPK